MIISREIYEAALLISRQPTVYVHGLPAHQKAIDAGVACVNGKLIELTHKGEEVIRL
ncbi:hypothetical protein [Noviherbaspirillum aridicola]|uniref:Uncharacterized protein n=1 Tax=Noviherbaspirillum aridicola TaxID=2849687 RepID=A0ABQ4Q8Y8_9BURK|nr:hypothetical protein [Noviherbaspirillum aridicola]GIZ53377.1 hypothetical protein NCCP691_33910 [Noviherbaspirillum aridicola]